MPRILSLLPSATEIVCALGLESSLVGRSHECDFPPSIKKLPACTASLIDRDKKSFDINLEVHRKLKNGAPLFNMRWDVIRSLSPDVIMAQSQCDLCSVGFNELSKEMANNLEILPEIIDIHPHRLSDVWMDIERIGRALNVAEPAQGVVRHLALKIEAIFRQTSELVERPVVAAIEWIDPLRVAGNWIPEMITLAGGQPAFGQAGMPSTWMSWERLKASNPDIIAVLPCGFDVERTRQEMPPLTTQTGWYDLQAVQNNRVFLLDGHQYFYRSGPRLVDSLEILAEVIHPDMFDFGHKFENWQYWGFNRVE